MNEQIPKGKIKCPMCDGTGREMIVHNKADPSMNVSDVPPNPPCPDCNGTGFIDAPEHG